MNKMLEVIDSSETKNGLEKKDIYDIVSSIKDNIGYIIDNNEFFTILEYLEANLANFYAGNIDEDLKILLNNTSFLDKINNHIEQNIHKIGEKDAHDSYFKLAEYIFLLSFGEKYKFIIDFNTYDLNSLSYIYDLYIEKLSSNINNEYDFEVNFKSFLLLIEAINKLCFLNEIDSFRKQTIIDLTSIMEEKIIKLTILFEEKKVDIRKINELKHFIGRFKINFSHIHYISTKGKSIDDIIIDFRKILNNQIEGFNISKVSNFGNKSNLEQKAYQVFLGNIGYTVSILIQKLESIKNDKIDLMNNSIFKDIVNELCSILDIDTNNIKELGDVKDICINIFKGLYFEDSFYFGKFRVNNSNELLKKLIKTIGDVNYIQLESIHHIIMFMDNIDSNMLIQFGIFLLKNGKYKNYNYEFMKLKTLDVIISKLPKNDNSPITKTFLKSVVNYIEENKVASQLLHTYARLYLSISYYFSHSFDKELNNLSLEYYTLFSKMIIEHFNFEKYGKSLDNYAYNIGLFHIGSILCNEDCHKKYLTKGIDCRFSKEELVKFGLKQIKEFKRIYNLELRNNLDRELGNLLEGALNRQDIDDKQINENISTILSSKIFHGITGIEIIEIHNRKVDNTDSNKLYMGEYIMDLFNGYRLCFSYPKSLENVFYNILEDEKEYITQNIKNIITGYLKKRDFFIDHLTGLPSEIKLKEVLKNLDKTISFILIKLNNIKSINNGYSYELGDEYLKKVAKQIESITGVNSNLYRLTSAQFGIVIENDLDIDYIVEKINKIRINLKGNTFYLKPFIGIVRGESDRIIEKASTAISKAKRSGDIFGEYIDDNEDIEICKGYMEYSYKLEKALEENRLTPFFQPIFDTKTGKIYKYETLMRIDNGNGKYESPFRYLLSAGKFGRLIAITLDMIPKVFKKASTDNNNYSINLSGDDLSNNDLVSFISINLEAYNVNPNRITFEILEGEFNDDQKNIEFIKKLKEIGFKISMDDVGASNSNINRLLDFLEQQVVDEIKIDGKIIQALISSKPILQEVSKSILTGFINGAHNAGVKVVGEYINNRELVIMCKVLGIDYLQGFHLGEPSKDTND